MITNYTKGPTNKISRKMFIYAYLQFPSSSPVLRIIRVLLLPIVIHTNPQSASNWRTTRVRERVNKLTHEHSSRSSITPHYSHNQPRPRWRESKSLPRCFPRKLWHTEQLSLFRYKLRARKGSSKQKMLVLVRRYLAEAVEESGSQNKLGMMLCVSMWVGGFSP